MSDNIRLVECIYTPSSIYAIYDYTKIVYVTDSYLCIREIVTPEMQPQFIRINSQYNAS